MASKILRKLTIKEAVGSKAELLKIAQSGRTSAKDADGKEVLSTTGSAVRVLMVIGHVSGIVPGEGDNGPYVKLKGEFEATNLISGEVFSGVSTCILPNFVADTIAEAVKAGAEAVDFAVTLSVKYNEDAITMYEFEATSLMPPQTSQSVSAIRAQLEKAGISLPAPTPLPALAAPAPAAATPTPPAPAAAPAPAPAAATPTPPAPAAAPAPATSGAKRK